jgi:predicted branched-subunit amino acid permease
MVDNIYSKPAKNRKSCVAQLAIVLNILWVIGSYLGLLLGWFPVNTAGKYAIALIAEVVVLFAVLEIVALWRLSREQQK